ncbi:MAG: hypothetical protein ABI241_00725 [Bacteroidia bacterium]
MISNDQFYYVYTDISNMVSNFQEKLANARLKNKLAKVTVNYDEQDLIITRLQGVQTSFHQMYQDMMEKDSDSGKIMKERENYIYKINKLEKELATLKENVNL